MNIFPRVAAIDIGTNTLLLLIAEKQPNGTWVAARDECRFGRLGQKLDQTGTLQPESVERCLQIMSEYATFIRDARVDIVRAVGTQALREASNASSFLTPACSILGNPIEIIPGHREAELVQIAVDRSLPQIHGQPYAIADVGGGSTEILICTSGLIHSLASVPIGSVRLTERYLTNDPPINAEIQSLFEHIDTTLAPLSLPKLVPLVGTSGTATTIASMQRKLAHYDPERIHGTRVSKEIVEALFSRCIHLPLQERYDIVGLEHARADVIAAGLAIYLRLLERIGGDMTIADRGVRWGLVHELEPTCLEPS